MHSLLILLIVSLTASFLFVRGNLARYWAENKDAEQLQYERDKAAGKPCINPIKEDSKYLGKIFFWIAFVVIVAFILCSCSSMRSGYYVVTDVRGRTVNLKGLTEDYYFPTDTLKIGDKVHVTRVKREVAANIW